MKTAFLFAGQGSQKPGMGRDLYAEFEGFKNCFDKLPAEQRSIAFDGSMEDLSQTQNTQAILLAFGMGIYSVLKENGIKPDFAAGLSLGEYTALCSAGVFEYEDALKLVQFRANEMVKASKDVDSSMAAVLGLEQEPLAECCKQASNGDKKAEITNVNCPGQIVISGEASAVAKASELALEKGARRVMPLLVSGPFHTSYMKPVGDALLEKTKEFNLGEEEFPVLFNYTGDVKQADESISELLSKQVQSGVLMEKIIRKLIELGVTNFVEIGPGNALSGFVKKVDRSVKTISITTADELRQAIEELGR